MDHLASLLKNSTPQEPPQIVAIKHYVKNNHNTVVQVSIGHLGYSITVPSGGLATTLRMEQPQIRAQCHLEPNKKLFIRIGEV